MKVGIFGGTFDPVHEGHVQLAREAMTRLGLDRLFVVPAYRNPLKVGGGVAPRHRVAMLKLAFAGMRRVELNRHEIRKKGKSFFIDTLRYLRARCGSGNDFYFVGGSDLVESLPRWKSVQDIAGLCTMVFFERPGSRVSAKARKFCLGLAKSVGRKGAVRFLKMKPMPVSATRVRSGEDPRKIERVREYIERHKLY